MLQMVGKVEEEALGLYRSLEDSFYREKKLSLDKDSR
jgi:hypothetical protein